jgi:hypothetical protein
MVPPLSFIIRIGSNDLEMFAHRQALSSVLVASSPRNPFLADLTVPSTQALMRPGKWSYAGNEVPARLGIFPKTAAMSGRYRGVRLIAEDHPFDQMRRPETSIMSLRTVCTGQTVM